MMKLLIVALACTVACSVAMPSNSLGKPLAHVAPRVATIGYMRRTGSSATTGSGATPTTGASSATTPKPPPTPTGAPSSSSATPPPPPASGPVTQITQVIAVPVASVADFVGATKTVYERGYGHTLGIFDSANNRYHAGCSVEGTAQASRRAISVSFAASVSEAKAAAARTQSAAIVGNPGLLVAGITAAKASAVAAGDNSLAGVAVPTAAQITAQAPAIVVVSSGVDRLAASWMIAVGLAFVALRH